LVGTYSFCSDYGNVRSLMKSALEVRNKHKKFFEDFYVRISSFVAMM